MPINQKVRIEKVVFGGAGLGRIGGKVCFVNDVLEGEEVLVRVRQEKKGFSRAKLLKVLKPAPLRIDPPCRYVHQCGGCQYQHMSYPEELRVKDSQVREALSRGLGLSEALILPIRSSGEDYHYRHHVTLHPVQKSGAGSQALGFISRDDHSVVAIDQCLLADPRLDPIFKNKFSGKRSRDRISFWISESGEIFSDAEEHLFKTSILNQSLWASSKGFFQNNLKATELILRQVSEWEAQFQIETFMDLYAGAGLFSLLASHRASRIICIEESEANLKALRKNIEGAAGRSYEILEGRVEDRFPLYFQSEQWSNLMVFLDPPRAGLHPDFAQFLASSQRIHSLVYLSCDLAILVRDLKVLLEKNQFEIRQVVPFDMFPRTKHIEVAVLLAQSGPARIPKGQMGG